MKKFGLFFLLVSSVFGQNEFPKDSILIDILTNDSIQVILDSLSTSTDSLNTIDTGEVAKTDQTLRRVKNFYASGLNNRGFFLSRNIPPKVRPEKKSNMLFSFFTTSCIPCRKEIPFLSKQIDKYNMQKAFLVNVGEEREKVQKYIDQYQYNMQILLDPYGVVAKKLEIETTPVMMIISGDGELLYRHNGFMEDDTTEMIDMFNEYFGTDINEL